MIAHSAVWTVYAGVVMAVARCVARDWRDPAEDRQVVLATAGTVAVLLAIAGVLIAVA